MESTTKITTFFLDIGGVLGTNGWDRNARKEAAGKYGLNLADMNDRHHLTFDTYEVGKITLDEYLDRLVFFEPRSFSREEFKEFMLSKSVAFPDMINLICGLKKKYKLKVAVVNNEGRELNEYRIQKFGLSEFVDFYVSSAFAHFRKPDADIYRLALDIAQVPAENILYLDDRALFIQVAAGLGIKGIVHRDYEETKAKMAAEYGLSLD